MLAKKRCYLTWWRDNPALQQMLGLCPLLAISTSWQSAWPLAAATLFVLIATQLLIASVKHWIPKSIRLPIFVFLISSWVMICQYVLTLCLPVQAQTLNLYLSLITTNCVILAEMEQSAYRLHYLQSFYHVLLVGGGFISIMLLLAGIRQIFFVLSNHLFLFSQLPIGAFWGLAMLVVLHRLSQKTNLASTTIKTKIIGFHHG